METVTPKKPNKKPTKDQRIAELENQLAELSAALHARDTELAQFKQAIEARNAADVRSREESERTRSQLGRLLKALKPVEAHTREWGEAFWPKPEIAMIRKLTFGDIKGVVDAYKDVIST